MTNGRLWEQCATTQNNASNKEKEKVITFYTCLIDIKTCYFLLGIFMVFITISGFIIYIIMKSVILF